MKRLSIFLYIIAFAVFINAATVDTLSINTKYLDSPENIVVISPNISLEKPCPSIYLLNGHNGNHLTWINLRKDLPELADTYGVFLIMPDGKNSWYWDSPIDSTMQMETFIADELVPFIDTTYNTIPSPTQRAISGLSMGGHGAMWLAFRHPEIWKNVGSMSGGLDIRPFPEKWQMMNRLGTIDENPEYWNNHTVINIIPTVQPAQHNIIFDCGIDDFFMR